MAAVAPTEARFPRVATGAGHYESFYLKACHPAEPLGVWIRYTVHKPPGAEATGSLWFTLFDAAAPRPSASKVTLPAPESGGGDWIRVGESRFRAGMAMGSAPSIQGTAAWDLRFETREDALLHLPRAWMYRGPLPRTKLLSPAPAARFSGRVSFNDRELALDGWRGMVGHNWGSQHAERWIWLHGLGFEGCSAGTWLDAAIGRVRIGPVTTPWITGGAVSLDGVRHPLGAPERQRSTRVHEQPDRCEFVVPGREVTVRGTVEADPKDFVGWIYADPGGGQHHTLNCSIAQMRLVVTRGGRPPLELRLAGGAAYELGTRERDHGVPIEPFPDE
jgi:hypothetical protein